MWIISVKSYPHPNSFCAFLIHICLSYVEISCFCQMYSFFHCCCIFQQNIFLNILIIFIYIVIFCLFCTILYVFQNIKKSIDLWIFSSKNVDLSFYTKHLFLFSLCKSSIPHTQNVDNVDNFVYNFNLRDFSITGYVDRVCMTLSTFPTSRHSLCNLSNHIILGVTAIP